MRARLPAPRQDAMTTSVHRSADARLVVQTWFATRLLMALVGVWLMLTEGRKFSDLVGNWDVQHFLAIAADGYVARHNIAFFPGWPLLLRCWLLSFSGHGICRAARLLSRRRHRGLR